MQKIDIDIRNGKQMDVLVDWNTGAAYGDDNKIPRETETQEVPTDGDTQELEKSLVIVTKHHERDNTKEQEMDSKDRPVKYYTISISGTALALFLCCCCLLCCCLW